MCRYPLNINCVFCLCLLAAQAGNAATQVLLRAVNVSGLIHMVPAVINDDYVIRFAVCSASATDDDILYAWNVITDTASKLQANQSASFDIYRPEQQQVHLRRRILSIVSTGLFSFSNSTLH